MSEDLLSDLCSICHIHPHQYCCPRCTARTCSLLCVKKHKIRSQCNGVRDPTKYIRRAALLTPKGLDNDFNYLTGVERKLAFARKDAMEKGVNRVGNAFSKGKHPQGGSTSRLEKYLYESGAVILRAPPGMMRRKTNQTKLVGKNKELLMWTVEWVRPSGSLELGSCFANQKVSDAFKIHLKRQASKERVKESGDNQMQAPPESTPNEATQITEVTTSDGLPNQGLFYFYLHMPRQPSKRPVLRSLSPDVTPSTCLQGQTIIEYPTIFALEHPPSELPPQYILDIHFFKKRRPDMARLVDPTIAKEDGEVEEEKEIKLDNEKLDRLESVINQDLQGLKGITEVA